MNDTTIESSSKDQSNFNEKSFEDPNWTIQREISITIDKSIEDSKSICLKHKLKIFLVIFLLILIILLILIPTLIYFLHPRYISSSK
ncbi:unnamed protein product [Adineta ricciae]|uniref:Uncharacterized protein n=1 Tax=Adineta ricciae TaxID=249248 RepID=A0A814JVD9_ADIRI|nr:unnamed protein product [Adineta ricciae]